MADERVVIKIDVKADTSAIDRVQRKLAALCAQADSCDDTFKGLSGDIDKTSESQKRLGRESDNTSSKLKKMGKETNGLSKILKGAYKFALIGAGIETAALAVALSSVNGLLATGRFLVKAYHVAMSGLAKAAAIAGVALATVAAAQRQYAAAQQAGKYGGFQASSIALRTMTADARLAGLSMKSLTSAFAAASKNAKVTGATTSAIAGLMDFAAASGDIEKGVTQVATLVSLIQKGGTGGAGVAEAAKQLGPEFEKAFKEVTKGGKASAAEVLRAFSSGDLAKKAGIFGSFQAMQGTLMGQFKAFMTQMQNMFADLGARFISPVQVAFEEIRRIVTRTFTQISPLLSNFATGTLLDKVVNGIDKISQFLVKLFREYLPNTQSFFGKLSGFWDKLTSGFERFNAYLRKFSDASKIINKFFGQILRAIGGGLKGNFEAFGKLLVENKDDFDKFGSSLANLITQIFKLFGAIREAFMRALPAITQVVDAIAQLVKLFGSLVSGLSGLGGGAFGLGGMAALGLPMMAGMGGKGGKGEKGRFGKMSKGSKIALAAGALGIASLGQIPGVGDFLGATLAPAMMAGMLAPSGKFGVGKKVPGFFGLGKTSKGMSYAAPAAMAAGTIGAADYLSEVVGRKTKGNAALTVGTGAAVGALGGAATGAMIGAAGGPIGAAGGAVIGLLVGGVVGFMKNSSLKKEARKAAEKFVSNYSDSVKDALGNNDMKAAQQMIDDFSTHMNSMADAQVKSGEASKKANQLWLTQGEELQKAVNVMGARFTDLTRISGMTEQQIQDVANAANVDLGNSMLSLQEILAATGIATARFGDDFNNALTDTYASAVAGIRQTLEIVQAPDVLAAAGRTFGQKARAGTVTDEDRAAFFETMMQQELLLAGGDTLQAFKNITRQYGTPEGGGSQFTVTEGGKKGDLYGLRDILYGGAGAQIGGGALAQVGMGVAGLTAENIISEAARLGIDLGMSKEALTSQLGGLGSEELIRIAEATSKGTFLTPQVQGYAGRGGAIVGTTPEEQLKKLLGTDISSQFKIQETASKTMKDASTGFKNSSDAFTAAVELFGQKVELLNAGGDTATPRRNFVNMMNVHNRINGGIAGRRSITSGIRGFNLGSMNSDHAAGRAYDLVGQNLGLYQVGIRAGGGYAEFHGTGAQRHLHVVPGMDGAIGDTATPYMGGTMSTPTTMTNNNSISVTVNAAQGMDVQALANEVMARIEAAQASWSERR